MGWSKPLLLLIEAEPFWPEDQPLEDPEEVVAGQLEPLLERPGGLLRPDLPHKSCPIAVKVEVGLVLMPQESFGFSEDVGLLKLQVGEVNPKVFSTKVEFDELVKLLLVLLDIKSRAEGATDPGVKVGSSSGFFNPGPFQGLPGSNSGMPKASMPFKASLLVTLLEDPPPIPDDPELLFRPGAPGATETDGPPGAPLPGPPDFSGHPELVELEGSPQVSSPPKPRPGDEAFLPPTTDLLALPLLPPKRESPGVNFH